MNALMGKIEELNENFNELGEDLVLLESVAIAVQMGSEGIRGVGGKAGNGLYPAAPGGCTEFKRRIEPEGGEKRQSCLLPARRGQTAGWIIRTAQGCRGGPAGRGGFAAASF